MIHDLETMLAEERNVFAAFNIQQPISPRVTAFASPDTEEIPHWNMAYPHELPDRFTAKELDAIEIFFRSRAKTPHLLSIDPIWRDDAAEISEYFYLDGRPLPTTAPIETFEFAKASHELFEPFNEILRVGFGLSPVTAEYFKKQLALLSKQLRSRFWVARENGRFCGISSTFGSGSSADFLFNVVVPPDCERRGVATRLLGEILRQTARPIYVYSHNAAMRKGVLPKLGFVSAGTIYVVPLSVYRARVG